MVQTGVFSNIAPKLWILLHFPLFCLGNNFSSSQIVSLLKSTHLHLSLISPLHETSKFITAFTKRYPTDKLKYYLLLEVQDNFGI